MMLAGRDPLLPTGLFICSFLIGSAWKRRSTGNPKARWPNGKAPDFGSGDCAFEPHVGRISFFPKCFAIPSLLKVDAPECFILLFGRCKILKTLTGSDEGLIEGCTDVFHQKHTVLRSYKTCVFPYLVKKPASLPCTEYSVHKLSISCHVLALPVAPLRSDFPSPTDHFRKVALQYGAHRFPPLPFPGRSRRSRNEGPAHESLLCTPYCVCKLWV